jgi:glycosyltransferase involved in cell wall biosynthesis
MIVKNEKNMLARCLDSIRPIVHQIVIVDTGSTDATPAIAEQFGVHMIQRAWDDHFSHARNAGLEAVSAGWILVLDADEELDPDSAVRLPAILKAIPAQTGGLRLRIRNLQPGGDLCRFTDQWTTRLFRAHPTIRYEGMIHEQVTPSILSGGWQVADADLTILHHGYAQSAVQGQVSRSQRNLDLLLKALTITPDDAYLLYQVGVTYHSMAQLRPAFDFLHRALEQPHDQLNPEVLEILHMKLAQLYLARDEYAPTLVHARASLYCNPENLVAMYLAALALMFQNDIRGAYPYFVRIQQHPGGNLGDVDDLQTILAYCRGVLGI